MDAKERLLERQRQLQELVQQAGQHSGPVELDQQAIGRLSRLDAIQQQQMMQAEIRQAKVSLTKVDAALVRLAEGEYGECLECGNAIAEARLALRPEASLCIQCQSDKENR